MIDPRHCDRFQERLPLLHYPGELGETERRQLLAHLDGCAECRRVQAGFKVAAEALDELPLDLPSAERQAGLRARILSAINDNVCAHEVELIEPSPELTQHLVVCDSCRTLDRDIELIVCLLAQQAPVPSLTPEQQATLRAGILAGAGLAITCPHEVDAAAGQADAEHVASCTTCQELTQVQAALDLVVEADADADAVPAAPRSILDEVMARVAISETAAAEDAALVGPALDLVPDFVDVPALSEDATAALQARILEATGVAQTVAAAPLTAPEGRVVRFPGWFVRAAAAVIFTSTIGLGGYLLQDGPWVPADPAGSLAQALEHEAELAEKLARASDEAPRGSGSLQVLKRAERQFAGVLRQANPRLADPRVKSVALRAKNQLMALRLVTKATTAAGLTRAQPQTEPQSEQSLLISYGEVIRDYPDSLATLWVLKRFQRSLKQKGAIKYDLRSVRPANERLAEFLRSTRSRNRAELLRDDYADLTQLVSVAIVEDVNLRQAILLQQGIHAQELGNAADAERHFRDAIAIDAATRAGKLAQERLDVLTVM